MKNLKKQLLPITTFVRIDVRRLFRDRVAIFFVFVFPLIFLVIFGSIFRGNDDVSFRVGLLNESQTQFAKDFEKQIRDNKVFKVDTKITNLEAAKEKMNRSQLDATIILPSDFGEEKKGLPGGQATVLYDQSNQQAGQTLGSIMESVFKGINEELSPSVKPFSVKTQSTATKGLSQFDYTFSGILGFTLLSLGIFGPTTVFPRLKQRGVLRRYHTTTLKVWQYFIGAIIPSSHSNYIVLLFRYILRGWNQINLQNHLRKI